MSSTLPERQALSIREVSLDELAHRHPEARELFAAHWREVALHKRLMALSPDWDKYRDIEDRGNLLILAVFAGDLVVGYSVSFVLTHLHYEGLRYAQNDVLFVAREHRASGIGKQLITETEDLARARGAQMVMFHAKPGTALEAVMPRLGYGVQDVMFSKEL